ncbi:protein SSUH2 homolog [Pyxicephalus adspersus]|uniref:protein SSUH2 homolog n=1 Tax=Pyxicephalus adspersus TaxID=30357 RepID=UPI003B5BDA88
MFFSHIQTTCPACMGAPHSQGRMCFACGGNGRRLCTGCCGRGYKVCNFCLGAKSILQYIEVTVYWTVFTTTALTNQETEIPSKKLTKVTGVPVFREEQVVVPPIMDFPDDSVNKTSQKIMQEHLSLSTSCRILGQKQILELLPVTKVKSTWKEKKCDFFVFGNECEVYTDTYPQTGRCTIM